MSLEKLNWTAQRPLACAPTPIAIDKLRNAPHSFVRTVLSAGRAHIQIASNNPPELDSWRMCIYRLF
jgi:hypothetical protein